MYWEMGNKKIKSVWKQQLQNDVCLVPPTTGSKKRKLIAWGKKKYPVAIRFWFKCHLASDTGSHGADVAARSWEQIRDLPRISERLKEDVRCPKRCSPLQLWEKARESWNKHQNKTWTAWNNEVHELAANTRRIHSASVAMYAEVSLC